MVVFTCQHCGESLQKPKAEKHYNTKCRFKNPSLTCVDCMKDFFGQEYVNHTQCLSEAQRYSAAGTVIKEPAGKNKQQKYVQMIQNLLNSKDLTNVQRLLLEICSKFENVPRKQLRFNNFMRNVSKNVKHTVEDLNSVFRILDKEWKKETQTTISDVENQEKSEISVNKEVNETRQNGHKAERSEKENDIESDKCETKKTKKKKNHDNSQSSLVEEEIIVENNNGIEDTKENMNAISKKQLKKQKKYQKYLAELENEAKNKVNENTEENVSDDQKTNKRKLKKSKVQINSGSLEPSDKNNENFGSPVDISTENTTHKKSKKRKPDDSISEVKEKKKKEVTTKDEELVETPNTFDWTDMIVRVLQSRSDKELSLKKLGKKVVNEYQAVKPDHRTYEDLLAKFNKKVKKIKGVRVLKDKAKLIE